jgi:hypothetical protein
MDSINSSAVELRSEDQEDNYYYMGSRRCDLL